ncbi:hypothetical protein VTN00DRAFT_8973 [Thermoascus crustaceus]|uniref:uncharacterized protein n=1 Tax=Thermoascus crustaceus TaxID=5088 RepID=UPI0037430A76
MPRRSSRVVSQPAEAPAQAPKRRPSAPLATATSATKSKKQKPEPATTKGKPIRSTTKKSKYFGNSAPEESESESQSESAEDSGSAFEDTRSTSPVPGPEATERASTKWDDDEEEKPKQKKRGGWGWAHGRKRKSKVDDNNAEVEEEIEALKGKELWREGVRTGLGPGKEIYIKIPHRKARDPGDTPYQDHTIHPNTMLFLQDLKENNEREWLKAHDADYRASKRDWETFVETLTEKIIEKDSTIPELPTKDLVFRIHRDIRFSNDPTPYKAHFSAAWSRTGKKGHYASYYVHLQPGSCFVGSGLWMPEASKLALLREDIDRNSRRIKAVLNDAGMRREFFKGIPDDEEKAVKAFVSQNQESALKTKPKGYEQDNENIELLRLRNFTVGKPLPDAVLLSPDAQDTIAELVGIMVPFVTYLNSVVMPDPADDSDEESDDGAGG